jgi:hypothetical protein
VAARPISREAVAGLALAALFVGLTATPLAYLALPVGLAGMFLALFALGDIRLSGGRLGGRWLAVAALLAYAALFSTALFWAPCSPVVDASRRMKCHNSLKTLASAMLDYRKEHGTLPPHAVYSPGGTPLLSWRVLLLPYLGEGDLFDEFRLDEAWDGPHNARLLAGRPAVYAAPDWWPPGGRHGTFYQVFVGRGAAFEGRKGMRFPDDFPDGPSQTILIVETGEAVPWTKPEDLPYDPELPLPKLGGLRLGRGVFMAGTADGTVRSVGGNISEATLRAAITRNGGESLGPDW